MCFQSFVRQTNGPEVRKSRCFISLACPTCHLRFWMSTFVMSQRALTSPQGRYYHPSWLFVTSFFLTALETCGWTSKKCGG